MKKSSKIIFSILILLALVLGFLIGISVDYPKPGSEDLAGTVGRMNNYRNVKIGENDIQLRSDLLSNPGLKKQVLGYLSFYYAKMVDQGKNIVYALDVSNVSGDFATIYQKNVEALKDYSDVVELSRLDVLNALQAVQKLSDKSQEDVGPAINNAKIAIAQMNYKGQAVIDFIEAIEIYLENAPDGFNPDLKKVHDLLTLDQVNQAVASNDKPLIKYFDKKPLYSNKEELNFYFGSQEKLNGLFVRNNEIMSVVVADIEKINAVFTSQSGILGVELETIADMVTIGCNSVNEINAALVGNQNLLQISQDDKLKVMAFNTEGLESICGNLVEKLGVNSSVLEISRQ